MKITTVRMEESIAKELALVAAVEDLCTSELIREGIEMVIERYRDDEDFKKRAIENLREQVEFAKRFAN